MRILKTLVLFCLLFNLTAHALPSMKPAPKTLVIATSEWRPYVQNNSDYFGYAYETVVAAFKAVGYQVKIEFMTWEEADKKIKRGEVDAFFPAYFAKQNKRHMAFSHPFSGGPLEFVRLKNTKIQLNKDRLHRDQWRLFRDLSHYKFGAVRYYTHLPAFDKNQQLHKQYVMSDKQNLQQLIDKKVDLIIMDKYVAKYLIRNDFSQYANQITFVEPPLAYKQLYLAVPRGHSQRRKILSAFNTGLKRINKNGELSSILDKDSIKLGALLD